VQQAAKRGNLALTLRYCCRKFILHSLPLVVCTVIMSAPLSRVVTDLQQYIHIPLKGPRATRVLELQPAADTLEPVLCSLKAISLDDYPQWEAHYTALSYTWDGQTPSCEVNCDGRSLLVTPNCNAAIRQLRSMTETKILWIDSICIDQQKSERSVAERNSQVALMGEIYKSAARVVVWLGEENRPVEAAMNKMVEIVAWGKEKMLSAIDPTVPKQMLRDHVKSISDSKLCPGQLLVLLQLTLPRCDEASR
jgi:hypothetical protein